MPGLSPAEWEAVRLSVLVASTSVVASLPLGLACGWLLARRRFPGKTVFETAVSLPLVLPPVVTGYLLLLLFGRNGVLGSALEASLGIRFVFDWKGAALASAVVSFPLMVRAMRVAFASVDTGLEQAARTLGAGPLDCFLTVTLPLARPGLIAGCLLAFARSLGEFGATIMLAGNLPGRTQTIPLYVYGLLETPGGLERAWPVVAASIILSGGALFIGERLEAKSR